MHFRKVAIIGTLAAAVGAGACNRAAPDSRAVTAQGDASAAANPAAELQRQREEEVERLDRRVAEIDRKYGEKNQKVVAGERTATAGLREELKEDVANVKEAVGNLRTTSPENWWDREEAAIKRTADDIQADVARLAGSVKSTPPATTAGPAAEPVSTAPFTSRRDKLVADLRARIDAMERALDNVKTRGTQKTEVEDTRARVKKLGEDVDKLASASADDWWNVSKARVTDYIDRVEASVNRLDDNRP